ncbi:rod shape-determining protein MreC [Segetibacter sp. 3557_3]|uniref:rod shape-determining protein MreC n=1 Tax=Segetibacter sp. 3557_3 TaxID=2547429 RepID=UPI001058ECDC|nr:rod shape-determining protein MreC [Segetibacter sp. 3557_3]TDH23256.1 rod shape-determining protein MreC [Segetibacter sp. 3557_3]
MKNIFLFIRRYFNFLFFLVLQIVSLSFLVTYNKTQEAVYSNFANEITGRVNTQYNKVQYYFQLKETNRQLSDENARLRNMLAANFEGPDTSIAKGIDTLTRDTTGRIRKFIWLPAKVVGNSYSSAMNYLTLHRGGLQGVKKNMAVVGPEGVVGTVIDVSDNYSRVMSLLHTNSRVSSMLLKGKIAGSVEWDGTDPRFLTLRNIPRSIEIKKGDSVVTSTYSANFPSNIMVGTIYDFKPDGSTNSYLIRLRAATNFYSIQYVNLVENIQWEEQRKLEATPVKNQ